MLVVCFVDEGFGTLDTVFINRKFDLAFAGDMLFFNDYIFFFFPVCVCFCFLFSTKGGWNQDNVIPQNF